MIETEFVKDGTIYSRGETVCSYKAGEKVKILEEYNEELVNIIILEGEGRGMIMYAERELLKL